MKGFSNRLRWYLRAPVRRIRRYVLVPLRRVSGPRIPIAMITGTKGKTTTTRMLAHMLSAAGHRVGFTSTDGIVINGQFINRIDSAGYAGAHTVLADRSITAAVLETARGDLLNTGMYIDRCAVAALLNVGREQIGIDGIDTVEQMAALKQQVIHASRGPVVLNADDSQCARLIGHYPSHRVILFSLVADNQRVHDHIEKGGTAYIQNSSAEGNYIERLDSESSTPVISIAQLPAGENGLFPQNIANAMAAAALAEGMAIPIDKVRGALRSFRNTLEQSPGRFNMLEGYSQTILLDNAIHVPSCAALVNSLGGMNVPGRRICLYETMGNRPDWHYTELGETLGPHFDHFICYDHAQHRRGRAPGEIPDLLKTGLIHAGVSPDCVDTAQGYTNATKILMKVVGDNDLVVILTGCAYRFLPVFLENFPCTESGTSNNRDIDGQDCC